MDRKDLQKLADLRVAEAKLLSDGKMWAGSYYLADYAVECALKACVAKKSKRHEYPDKHFAQKCYTHKVEELVGLADLKPLLDAETRADSDFARNWALVKDWSEEARYERKTTRTEAKARSTKPSRSRHTGCCGGSNRTGRPAARRRA